jgi:hypothetical protein
VSLCVYLVVCGFGLTGDYFGNEKTTGQNRWLKFLESLDICYFQLGAGLSRFAWVFSAMGRQQTAKGFCD